MDRFRLDRRQDFLPRRSHARALSRLFGILALGAVGMFAAQDARAATVASGFDLFFTPRATLGYDPGGGVILVDFESYAQKIGAGQGCGDNTFNFNDGNGCVATGNTDTIVERLSPATVASPPGTAPTIDVEMVSLSLISVDPLPLFGAPEFIHARILKDLTTGAYIHGSDNGSTMDILFDPSGNSGTWTSTLELGIELFGLTSGNTTIVNKTFTHDPAPWQRTPDGPTVEIAGINILLNGVNTGEDFFTPAPILHDDGGGTIHVIVPPTIPVPAALPLMLSGIAVLGGLAARRRRQM